MVLHDTLHLLDERVTSVLILFNLCQNDIDWLVFIEIHGLINFFLECDGLFLQLGHFSDDLLLHIILPLVGLFTGFAEFVAQLVLKLICCSDLSLATLLLLTDDLGADAQLEDARVQLDRVFDTLELLVNILHALDLSNIGSDTLRIFADRIDLVL